jgi:hypothetical protein
MSDLLKNAIADAKAVRATALANAKAALEEAFAPKLQSMLSEKLKADLGEEEVPAAPAAPVEMEPVGLDGEAPAPEAEAPAPAPAPEAHADAAQDAAMMGQAQEPAMEEETMEEYTTLGSGHPDPVEKTHGLEESEKASPDYKKTTKGHKTDNKGQEMVDATKLSTAGEPKAAKADAAASSDYKKTTAGHNTQDPQGASNELSKGQKKNDSGTSALKENDAELDNESLEEILKELEASVNDAGMDDVAPEANHQAQEAGMDEEINLDELLSEETEETEEKEEVEEGKLPKGLADYQAKKAGKSKEDDEEEKEDEKETVKENLSLKKELAEYRSAVKYLRDQINEVNLLNAKLLYTNKLFKQANLNNEQKLKVIESFDLTKSVREAKIVYATLAESFNFGAKKAAGPVKASTTIKTITEGLASKAVASTKPTKPTVLVEGAEMANRFKKLAGIRK